MQPHQRNRTQSERQNNKLDLIHIIKKDSIKLGIMMYQTDILYNTRPGVPVARLTHC